MLQEYDCDTCRDIWRMLTDDLEGSINLGSVEKVAATTCQGHGPLVRAFVADIDDTESTDVGFVKSGPDELTSLVASIENLGRVWDLLPVAKDSVPSHPGTGRVLNPEWADLDIVMKWKNTCLTTHGTACENPIKISNTRPEFLIDVTNKCLVRGCDTQSNYIALSYVWGTHQDNSMEATTRAELFEPGSLSRTDIQKYLPPIITHAMQLTSKIGEHYLWVDALCIDHRDQQHTSRELQAMAAIYSNALVTIVSADGNSKVGITGLQGISGPRATEQRIFPFGDEQISVMNTDRFFLSWDDGYFSRGWTYQEYKLPSRSIIFLQNQVHWQCHCSVWHEELTFNTEVDKYIDPRLRVILAGFPDLSSLSHIIGSYNRKTLTYEEDALPAISGLLSIMSRSFTGGFLFGLPEMYFEQCLGWRPFWAHDDLTRRVTSDRPLENKLVPCDLPSWSWIGWQGHVRISHDAARINPRESSIGETFPITEWYCGQSPTDAPSKRRRIRSTWYEQRTSRKDFTKHLPPGWTRHDISTASTFRDEPALYPTGCDKYVFRHPAMCDPDTEINDWHYPFPVADIQPSTPFFTPEQLPYLFCKTQSVHVHAIKDSVPNAQNLNILHLCGSSGSSIGNLHLHHQDQLALFPAELPGREVELVALYKLTNYSKSFNEEKKRYDFPIEVTERVCVLWIEWENGVAYRRAVGSVYVREWEKLGLKEIDLVLG